ncbi:MAG: hypothetical protein HAW66_04620 [Shewanella sp.]|nr:hypothetical protein [Shewanella sp.]
MSNIVKRQKRAKYKAKSFKIHKQHQLELKNLFRDIASISPELEYLFETLLDYDTNLDSLIPEMKLFVAQTGKVGNELMAETAIVLSLYMWWKHNPSETVYVPAIAEIADTLVIQPEFKMHF